MVGGGNKRSHHVLLDQLNPEVQKHMEVAASAAALEAPAISKETSRRGREKYREEEAVKEKQSESMAICSQSEPTEEVKPCQLLMHVKCKSHYLFKS